MRTRKRTIVGSVDPGRSALMARVKGKNSKPELTVRSQAHALGFRFRLHQRNLPGTPDLVFPRLKKVVFVHGCFWHRHAGCSRTTNPKTRAKYWKEKFLRNVRRDRSVLTAIADQGWEALVVWECETFDHERLSKKLKRYLSSRHLV